MLMEKGPDIVSSDVLVSCLASNLSLPEAKVFQETQVDRHVAEPSSCDRYIGLALLYLFRKATLEVKEFNSVSFIKKHTIEMDGILVSKNRMVEGLDYLYSGELNIDLGSLGIKLHAPVLDRFSPLSYSIANHVHWKLAPHRGMETQNRVSLEHVQIIQSMSLYKELSLECIRCNMRRKKFVQVEMGGLTKHQLTIAPPFWACQMDLFGPYKTFVPGYERTTRSRNAKECQVYVMCVVCPTSRLVNLQVLEKADASGILCGVTRLVCEVGFPKYFFIDQHSATMSAFSNAEFNFHDLQLSLHRQHGIVFETCSVGGHSAHGLVERVIRSIQQSLDDCGLKEQRLHALGLQSLCKLVENGYNSVPIGYSYDRDLDNTPILKMITPNMLKMGRTNRRTLDGPIRLAKGSRELLERVESLYDSWFKIWRDTVVPKLLYQPKWYDSDKDLKEGDLVFFQKKDGELEIRWVIGKVEQVVKSERDGKIRRVIVKYQNERETFSRMTDRSVRKLVKLFSIDEHHVEEDLAELQKRIESLQGRTREDPDAEDLVNRDQQVPDAEDTVYDTPDAEDTVHDIPDAEDAVHDISDAEDNEERRPGAEERRYMVPGDVVPRNHDNDTVESNDCPARNTRSRKCNCCCLSHCGLNIHSMGNPAVAYVSSSSSLDLFDLAVPGLDDGVKVVNNIEEDEEEDELQEDSLSHILKSLDLGA